MTEQEKCRVIQAAADEKKARDIVQMDMVGLMSTNDYFIICSANTATQVRAIADNIEEKMEEAGVSFLHKEGYREGEWVLLDYGDTVAHIFQQDAREYYALERLWGDAALTPYEEEDVTERQKPAPVHRKYGPSQVAELTAVRESEWGIFLDAETGNTSDDILLHTMQQTAPVKVGDRVRVFLYLDPKRRLTASMRTPRMKEGQVARLRVINVTKEGAFLDVGAERGIFLPYAGMRGRPQVGEVVWAKLYTDKSGRLAVTMEVEDELRRASRPAEGVRIGDRLKGSVYNITERGIFLFTEERYIAFIDHQEAPRRPRVGETVEIRVTYLREDGRLNASLRPPKEEARTLDADRLLALLEEHGGKMPYTDATSPAVLKDRFGISKAAFKRALGRLMKEGRVRQEDGWTYLLEEHKKN